MLCSLLCIASPLRAEDPEPVQQVRPLLGRQVDYRKFQRSRNGGWVNMALGVEGAYGSKDAWFSNATVGMRIGNYRDVVQFEVGLSPGVRAGHFFHMPLYASLKISKRSGKLYLKLGGAYNHIIRHDAEGAFSGRIGLGSAWKHFDWDWAFVDMESTDGDRRWGHDSPLTFGMRMAYYITR